jgi:hypothetical protein
MYSGFIEPPHTKDVGIEFNAQIVYSELITCQIENTGFCDATERYFSNLWMIL